MKTENYVVLLKFLCTLSPLTAINAKASFIVVVKFSPKTRGTNSFQVMWAFSKDIQHYFKLLYPIMKLYNKKYN